MVDNRWIQGNIENYSFLSLAKLLLPETEYPILSYPHLESFLLPGAEKIRDAIIPRFHCVSKMEYEDIKDNSVDHNKEYDEELSYGFYFPDVSLGELGYFFPKWFVDPCVEEIIRRFYTEEDETVYIAKRILVSAVFIILHEFGHYLNYKTCETKEEYVEWVYESKTPLRKIEDEIKKQSDNPVIMKELLDLRLKIYRECEEEHLADLYALDHLEEKVQEALEKIGG